MVAAPLSEGVMLDHVTLRTHDLEGTRAFLEAVLDLKPGYRPAFSFPGYWLYANGEPVVHLIPSHGGPADRTGETIDHVGFRLADHDGMLRKQDLRGEEAFRLNPEVTPGFLRRVAPRPQTARNPRLSRGACHGA
jgi:catechol 2,3-dioxygenase-like lactoylglutathione lyase family enzyme